MTQTEEDLTDREEDREEDEEKDRETDRQAERQTGRQLYRETNRPVHFLLLSSFLDELISLQLKFSSQYSANHTFLRLFSRVREVK